MFLSTSDRKTASSEMARASLSSLWPRLTLAVRLLYSSEMIRATFVDLLARANSAVVDNWKIQRSRELISALGAVYYDYKIWSSQSGLLIHIISTNTVPIQFRQVLVPIPWVSRFSIVDHTPWLLRIPSLSSSTACSVTILVSIVLLIPSSLLRMYS